MTALPPISFPPELRNASVKEQAMAILELFEDKRRHFQGDYINSEHTRCCVYGAAMELYGDILGSRNLRRVINRISSKHFRLEADQLNDGPDGWHRIQDLLIAVIVHETEAGR